MPPFVDLAGQRFGMLVVLSEGPKAKSGARRWVCRCDCGATSPNVESAKLNSGVARSCGCRSRAGGTRPSSHVGQRHHPMYGTWRDMHWRCRHHEDYAGRGITVCERWTGTDGFFAFVADLGPRPSLNHSIDRKDNNGHYEPGNVRWATPAEQGRNRRGVTLTERTAMQVRWLHGEGGYPASRVARAFNVSPRTVRDVSSNHTWT